MPDDDDYERRIASLMARRPVLKTWLDQMRGLALDRAGRTVMLGLTSRETEEFLQLNELLQLEEGLLSGIDPPMSEARQSASDRYYSLLEKHDIAAGGSASENLAYFRGERPKH